MDLFLAYSLSWECLTIPLSCNWGWFIVGEWAKFIARHKEQNLLQGTTSFFQNWKWGTEFFTFFFSCKIHYLLYLIVRSFKIVKILKKDRENRENRHILELDRFPICRLCNNKSDMSNYSRNLGLRFGLTFLRVRFIVLR